MSMNQRVYTQDEKDSFVEVAELEGIGPAMRDLGYPRHWNTAKRWCDDAGVEVTIDTLQRRAKAHDLFYTSKEQLVAAQAMLNRLVDMVETDPSLTADDLNKLSNGIQRAVQTIALASGNVTDRRETVSRDGTDVELYELLNEAKAKNANAEADMLHRNSKET